MVRYAPRQHSHTDPEAFTIATLAVIMRVAGNVPTGIHAHAIGHPEQQVSVRIGDALVYITQARTIAGIRRAWDAQQIITHRLRDRVSQTWLPVRPGTYPPTMAQHLIGRVHVDGSFVPADPARRTPPHVQMRVDRLVFQICDRTAWHAISEAWWQAQRAIDPGTGG